LQRYFIPKINWKDDLVSILEDDAHHISRVMRYNEGDQIICVHPNGNTAIGQIRAMQKGKIQVEIIEWLNQNTELPVHVSIAQGLPKGNKLELVLQKGTELGAARFHLFEADRSISKWDSKKSVQKMNRYRKIIKEASEQSHRNKMPIVNEPVSLEALIEASKEYNMLLFAYEEEAKTEQFSSLGTALSKLKVNDRILICIGPEGGFSNQEVTLLKEHQFSPVRLGKRILRTETASLYALASISYHFEELRWE